MKGKVILITGGTGSFGKAFAQFASDRGASEVRILSRDESKQDDLRRDPTLGSCKFFIGDVRDPEGLSDATKNTDYVFHAAALKQVPSCEFFPLQACKTNIFGTQNVLSACLKNDVESFVLLSTDKAVYPVNAMGLSKAMAERLVSAQARMNKNSGSILRISTTRYGNVLGSRGSIVPKVIELLKKGHRIPVTHESMTRYIMSLEESVELVATALEYGRHGEIFVKKVPAARVLDLIQAVAELMSIDLDLDIIGIREGEKLSETLITREEWPRVSEFSEHWEISPEDSNLDYSQYFDRGREIQGGGSEISSSTVRQLSVAEIKQKLLATRYVRELL